MTIKLLDGSKCKDFHGGWYPHMQKAIGKTVSDIKVTNPYDFKTNHFIEYEHYYYVWLNHIVRTLLLCVAKSYALLLG